MEKNSHGSDFAIAQIISFGVDLISRFKALQNIELGLNFTV